MFKKSVEEFKKENGYEIDGIWYPRVTSIISIKAKPALYRYYADQKSFADAEIAMNRSAQEGTLVHETIEAILSGEKDVTIPDSISPVVEEFKLFNQQGRITPHKIESQIISKKHGYAGTIDLLAEVDGKLGVLDIKTSQAIYRDYGIQTAAYVEALHEEENMPTLARWILRLDQSKICMNGCGAKLREKGGNTKINGAWGYKAKSCSHMWGPIVGEVELKELHNLENDTRAFLAAKQLWEWENEEILNQL